MSDGFMLYLDDDGVARHYDDTYDITIHCESEEEMQRVIEQLKSLQWIPCNERLPENGYWLWSAKGGEVQKDFYWDGHWEHAEKYGYEVVAWMPLPEPYKEDDHETD